MLGRWRPAGSVLRRRPASARGQAGICSGALPYPACTIAQAAPSKQPSPRSVLLVEHAGHGLCSVLACCVLISDAAPAHKLAETPMRGVQVDPCKEEQRREGVDSAQVDGHCCRGLAGSCSRSR